MLLLEVTVTGTSAISSIGKIKFSIAPNTLLKNCYVDYCITGSTDVQNTLVLQNFFVELLSKAQMTIREFTFNSKEVLQALPQDLIETKFMLFDKEE